MFLTSIHQHPPFLCQGWFWSEFTPPDGRWRALAGSVKIYIRPSPCAVECIILTTIDKLIPLDYSFEQNGVFVYDSPEKLPPIPDGLPDNIRVISKFGFKVAIIGGQVYWELASEEDFLESESKRLEINKEQVILPTDCYNTGPSSCNAIACNHQYLHWCRSIYNPDTKHYYCSCCHQ